MKTLRHKLTTTLLLAAVAVLVLGGCAESGPRGGLPLGTGSQAAAPKQVTLHADQWNEGKVVLFDALREGNTSYSLLPNGMRCWPVDHESHKLGSGDTAIHFSYLNCGGKIGYVNRDRVRSD